MQVLEHGDLSIQGIIILTYQGKHALVLKVVLQLAIASKETMSRRLFSHLHKQNLIA